MAKKKKLTKAQKIAKGARCKRLLENEDLRQAFVDVRDALHNQIDAVAPTDVDALVEIKTRLHLLFSVEANLMKAIKDGQLEEFTAEQQKTPYLGELK